MSAQKLSTINTPEEPSTIFGPYRPGPPLNDRQWGNFEKNAGSRDFLRSKSEFLRILLVMEYSRDIPASLIDPAPVLLRPVNKLSREYLDMVSDFREDGHFGNAILTRPLRERYEVVDGMYRWTAGHEAGLERFQCVVREMSDEEVLIWQIKLNATRRDTDPIEYARHLKRLVDLNEKIVSLKDLADHTGRSRAWVCEMLSLNMLKPEYQTMVQRGEITLTNAMLLAKLKTGLQPIHLEAAKRQSSRQFKRTIVAAVNEFRENLAAGKVEAFWSEDVIPYVRQPKEIIQEMETWEKGAEMVSKYGCIGPLDGWKLAVKWLMKFDDETLKYRKEKYIREEQEKLDELDILREIREERKRLQSLERDDDIV